MNQQPDKFFRDKLEHYHKPAPSTAWSKIAASQTKKNNKVLWFKIAASLLLLVVAGYILWPETTSIERHPSPLTKIETTPAEFDSAAQKITTEKIAHSETNVDNGKNPQEKTETKKEQPLPKRITPPKNEIIEKTLTLTATDQKQNESATSDNSVIDIPPAFDNTEKIIADVKSTRENEIQNITLVYSAQEVDEYLNKDALAEATSRDKKSSTLKKLLQKANDLKNNQDPFGELRQKKNEILALNFKNEKRGQNK